MQICFNQGKHLLLTYQKSIQTLELMNESSVSDLPPDLT